MWAGASEATPMKQPLKRSSSLARSSEQEHPPLTNTKSAAPLGVPTQAMADPAQVGRQLARKILSTKPVITPNFQTALYLFMVRRYPHAIGKLFRL